MALACIWYFGNCLWVFTSNAGINPVYCVGGKKFATKNRGFLTIYVREARVFTFNIIILGCLLLGAAIILRQRYQLNKREKTLNHLGFELNKTLGILKSVVKEKQETKIFGKKELAAMKTEKQWLADPGMLSTLITVIVNKYGDVKLGQQDFEKVGDEEYISVYVDVDAQSLVLSTDHDLHQIDPYGIVNFGNPDDNTYH